jgi:uncharacterized RDD family membrane protein YckC
MKKPSLVRHLAAVFYDFSLLTALLFFATALLLPFNSGEAFSSRQFFYPLYLLVVSFFFYGWFWTHGGQTLGLKAWKIRVVSDNGKTISWRQAFIRFIVSILSWFFLGLGFLWVFFDKQRRTWHDILSKSGVFFEQSD